MSRGSVLLVVAGLLLAASGAELFHVPHDQVVANQLLWGQLDAAEQGKVRAAWDRVQQTRGPERERLIRRMETLSRLQVAYRRRHDEVMDSAALDRLFETLPARVDNELDRLGVSSGPVAERLSRRTARRLERFLDNLAASGRLEPAERTRLESLPFDARLAAGLELQKREEIFFLSEASPSAATDDLAALDPLEVVAQARDGRRRRGFLGRVSALLELTPQDRQALADVPDEQLVSLLRALMVPKARALLEQRGVAPERIEAILAKPYRDLERALDTLVRGSAAPARR